MNKIQVLKEFVKMTDAELSIRVAKIRGWKTERTPFDKPEYLFWLFAPNGLHKDYAWPTEEECWKHDDYPNYSKDLNAMSEVEANMTDEQYSRYAWIILESVNGKVLECRAYLGATARQRAEAFVLTMEGEV